MKKIFLTLTLAVGVLGTAAEIRNHNQDVTPVIAPAPDMPPPICWPDCDEVSRS